MYVLFLLPPANNTAAGHGPASGGNGSTHGPANSGSNGTAHNRALHNMDLDRVAIFLIFAFAMTSIFTFLRGSLFTLAGERLVARFRKVKLFSN